MEIDTGDKVMVIPNLTSGGREIYGVFVNERMLAYAGQIVTIFDYMGRTNDVETFLIREDRTEWLWSEKMFISIQNNIKKL
ncbi:MAG: hypothetical protein ACOC1K_05765 [Nanoarchaeota archaeon]